MHSIGKLPHGWDYTTGDCRGGRRELACAGSLSEGAKPFATGLDQERGQGLSLDQ